MNKIQTSIVKAWQSTDGKKTAAGCALMIAGVVVPLIPGCQAAAPFTPKVVETGAALGGAGLFHKFIKWASVAQAAVPLVVPQRPAVTGVERILDLALQNEKTGSVQTAEMSSITK